MGMKAIDELFPYELLLEKHKKAVDDFNSYECPLCRLKRSIDGSITLDCYHRLDPSCLQKVVERYIDAGQVLDNTFICPIPECKKTISINIAKELISEEKLKKFNRFKLKLRNWGEGQMYVTCTRSECDFGVVIPETQEELACEDINCPNKGKIFCPKCNSMPSHKGMTCLEYLQSITNAKDAKEFEELCAKQGLIRWPPFNYILSQMKNTKLYSPSKADIIGPDDGRMS